MAKLIKLNCGHDRHGAYNWLFDDKLEKGFLIIRRASDNRIILRLKVEQ